MHVYIIIFNYQNSVKIKHNYINNYKEAYEELLSDTDVTFI